MGPIQSAFNQTVSQMFSIAGLMATQTAWFKMRQETKEQKKVATDLEARQQKYLQDYGKDVEYYDPQDKLKKIGRQLMSEDEFIKARNPKNVEEDVALRTLYRHDIKEFGKYEKQLGEINSQLYAKNKLDNPTPGTYSRAMSNIGNPVYEKAMKNAQENLINAQTEKRMTKEMR